MKNKKKMYSVYIESTEDHKSEDLLASLIASCIDSKISNKSHYNEIDLTAYQFKATSDEIEILKTELNEHLPSKCAIMEHYI